MSPAPLTADPIFGDVISCYTRADALDDGMLVDVSSMAREAGITFPVALTRAVWERCVAVPKGARMQDEAGRLWDVVVMLRFAINQSRGGSELTVRLSVITHDVTTRRRNVTLKALCGPGDEAEPVITVMLPEES